MANVTLPRGIPPHIINVKRIGTEKEAHPSNKHRRAAAVESHGGSTGFCPTRDSFAVSTGGCAADSSGGSGVMEPPLSENEMFGLESQLLPPVIRTGPFRGRRNYSRA